MKDPDPDEVLLIRRGHAALALFYVVKAVPEELLGESSVENAAKIEDAYLGWFDAFYALTLALGYPLPPHAQERAALMPDWINTFVQHQAGLASTRAVVKTPANGRT
jgi:hypothetical protein